VVASHATASLTRLAASPLLYPTVDPDELVENLFPEAKEDEDAAPPLPATEETLIAMPDAQLHLIDPDRSVDLGAGTLSIVRLLQGGGALGRFRPCLVCRYPRRPRAAPGLAATAPRLPAHRQLKPSLVMVAKTPPIQAQPSLCPRTSTARLNASKVSFVVFQIVPSLMRAKLSQLILMLFDCLLINGLSMPQSYFFQVYGFYTSALFHGRVPRYESLPVLFRSQFFSVILSLVSLAVLLLSS
jgi:hypothetical protein